jgi:hypothetical protein
MVAQYASGQIPLAVAEEAVNGQLAPTLEDWLGGPLPVGVPLQQVLAQGLPVDRGWLLVPAGALLSPFAIPRWPLRQWGDTLFEPFSAALAAIGLLVCLRFALRDRTSLCLLLFLAAALVPGFVSSYDRASIFRQLGAPSPVVLLAAVGFTSTLSIVPRAARRWTVLVTAVAVAISGMLIFDVINVRILGMSSLGLMVRSVDDADLGRVVIAYEPIWAIGTGRTATPDQAEEACAFVRGLVAGRDAAAAEAIRVLYGGSVKPANAAELFALDNVDGGLVGGAALDPEDFLAICKAAA